MVLTLLLSAVLFQGGDLTISYNGRSLVTGSDLSPSESQRIDGALSITEGLDPAAAQVLQNPEISFGILPDSVDGVAFSDGDTVLVKRDVINGSITRLSGILAHEADHTENGPLPSCQHAGSFMDMAAYWASLINRPGNGSGYCGWFKKAVEKAENHLKDCQSQGGEPTRADGSPIPPWPPGGRNGRLAMMAKNKQ